MEIGRYSGILRENRPCPLCLNDEVEDEIHVILICQFYKETRENMFRQIALINKNFYKLNLANQIKEMTSNINIMRKLAKFLIDVLKIGEANGMPSLPIVPTQVALRGNVGSVDVFRAAHLSTFATRGQGNALRGS